MTADTFANRVFDATLGYFQILSMYVGLRLGLYEALRDGELTAEALAGRAGVDPRYAREWLEQQATTGVLEADVTQDPPAFRLPDDAAESLLDPDSLSYLGATIRQLASLRGAVDHVVEAFRTGDGVPAEAYGTESADGQGGSNRPVYLTTLPSEWLPAVEPFRTRLEGGPTRVIDVGCGHGWSSIALARAYPQAVVDGYDPDEHSIEQARLHAEEAGLGDRVRFHAVDGAMLVVDERVRNRFDGTSDARDSYFYGWSVFDCLPVGRATTPSAGTGTVMRPDTLRGYAEQAGFTRFEILPIEHDAFRLYLLRP